MFRKPPELFHVPLDTVPIGQVFQVIPDPRQRLIALESGAIDIAYAVLPEELQFVELHPNLVLVCEVSRP